MGKLAKCFDKFLFSAVVVSVFTPAEAVTTQDDFDKAVACCWMSSSDVTSFCWTPDACRRGQEYCGSQIFAAFDNTDTEGYLRCSAMTGRGADADAPRLFVPPAPMKTSDGETLQVSSAVANSLRAATRVLELQRRGTSSDEIESVAGDEVKISTEESEGGERTVTIHSEGTDDIVLRFDAEGSLLQEDEEQ